MFLTLCSSSSSSRKGRESLRKCRLELVEGAGEEVVDSLQVLPAVSRRVPAGWSGPRPGLLPGSAAQGQAAHEARRLLGVGGAPPLVAFILPFSSWGTSFLSCGGETVLAVCTWISVCRENKGTFQHHHLKHPTLRLGDQSGLQVPHLSKVSVGLGPSVLSVERDGRRVRPETVALHGAPGPSSARPSVTGPGQRSWSPAGPPKCSSLLYLSENTRRECPVFTAGVEHSDKHTVTGLVCPQREDRQMKFKLLSPPCISDAPGGDVRCQHIPVGVRGSPSATRRPSN